MIRNNFGEVSVYRKWYLMINWWFFENRNCEYICISKSSMSSLLSVHLWVLLLLMNDIRKRAEWHLEISRPEFESDDILSGHAIPVTWVSTAMALPPTRFFICIMKHKALRSTRLPWSSSRTGRSSTAPSRSSRSSGLRWSSASRSDWTSGGS